MNAEVRFVLPGEDATDDDRWRALEIIGAIPMTIGQLERGTEAYDQAFRATPIDQNPHDFAHAALERFCEVEGLVPADVAAHAMRMRYFPVEDAMSGGVDLKSEYPETYAGLVTGPIDPLCLDFEDIDSIPAHVERLWLEQPIPEAELPY